MQAEQIAPTLARLEGSPFHVPVVAALYTGLRRSEQLALRWSDLDLDARTLQVKRALEETSTGIVIKAPNTTAGKRTITLPTVVVDALRAYRRQQLEMRLALGMGKQQPDNAPVFPGPDGGYQSPAQFHDIVAAHGTAPGAYLKSAGMHGAHARFAVDRGQGRHRDHRAPPRARQAGDTLTTYAHLFCQSDQAAADAIDV